jgi:hypothetical protein
MRLTKRELLITQLLLLALIGEGVVIGIHALFFPHYFYEHFLLGADWMPALGPYNQEMTRTAGALYLGLSALPVLALVKPVPRLLQAAGTANAFAAFPHMVYHLTMANMSGAQTIPQAGTLALTVAAGIALVVLARGGERRYFSQRLAPASREFFVAREESRIDRAHAVASGLILGLLLIEFLLIGIWTLLFPRNFYASFPFGTAWVSELGAYSAHLTIDTGALCFGFASAIVLALAWQSAILTRGLGLGTAGAALAEMIYHLTEAGKSGALATAVQAGVLLLSAAGGLALVFLARPRRAASAAGAASTGAAPAGPGAVHPA